MSRRVVVALAVVITLVACGGGGGGETKAAVANGGTCYDGTACASGLCLVRGPAPEGTCEDKPAGCATCGASCMDPFQGSCSLGAKACSSVGGNVTVGCSLVPSATEGQPCSFVVGCAKGLVCRVPDRTKPGACERLPDACGGAASCACLESVKSACPSTSACQVVSDVAVVQCG